jgi:hypothetical protein
VSGGDARVLTTRELNRALLARQLLLERSSMPVADAVEWLVGLQAQTPISPYVSLWSRLREFDPAALSDLLASRAAVRLGLMRGTIHLVTTEDALRLRPVISAVGESAFRSSPFQRALAGLDLGEVLEASRQLLEERPMSASDLGRRLVERWPDRDPASLAYASRFLLALVQVPPRGLWGTTGAARHTTLEAWSGRSPAPLSPEASERMVLRYLAAFGPATVADIRTWSWLTGLRDVVERLRPRLRTFRDERGRELFDVPDGPLPDPSTPAPPRFIADYDNVVLSHADRLRIVPPHVRQRVLWNWGAVLVDGFVAGTWTLPPPKGAADVEITMLAPLSAADVDAVLTEGARLRSFLAPDRTGEVRIGLDPDQLDRRNR